MVNQKKIAKVEQIYMQYRSIKTSTIQALTPVYLNLKSQKQISPFFP